MATRTSASWKDWALGILGTAALMGLVGYFSIGKTVTEHTVEISSLKSDVHELMKSHSDLRRDLSEVLANQRAIKANQDRILARIEGGRD